MQNRNSGKTMWDVFFQTKNNQINKKKPKGTKFNVFFCNNCKNSWEILHDYKSENGGKQFNRLEGFPSYGLERKECPECCGN